jgi:hypothetical protein
VWRITENEKQKRKLEHKKVGKADKGNFTPLSEESLFLKKRAVNALNMQSVFQYEKATNTTLKRIPQTIKKTGV